MTKPAHAECPRCGGDRPNIFFLENEEMIGALQPINSIKQFEGYDREEGDFEWRADGDHIVYTCSQCYHQWATDGKALNLEGGS